MPQPSAKPLVLVTVLILAAAVVFVDDRWIRIGIVLVPALLLARSALGGGGVGVAAAALAAQEAARKAKAEADRRSDDTVRRQIQDLLALIRDFYTTCHMVAVGQLEPAKAKAKARVVERKLNHMMEHMLAQVEGDDADSAPGSDADAGTAAGATRGET